MKQGRQCRAWQHKEAWIRYESDLAEYNKKKLQLEVEEKHAANAPFNRIQEALEELEAISHPDEEQEQLRDILRSIALRTHDRRTRSRLPARTASHR